MLGQMLIIALVLRFSFAAEQNKPHHHQGVLQPSDGKHIAYKLDAAQTKRLNSGEAVAFNERFGKSGRGVCLQDIHAPPEVCMDRIRDLPHYKDMVPKVKSVEIYSEEKFSNGTVLTGAKFSVGFPLLTFSYYLLMTYQPIYNTATWTLDYRHTSDFDDNTGHWQVMEHPAKPGWTRVLYTTDVKLFAWIPEFVVTFLTKTALIESTTWVRRESEKVARLLPTPVLHGHVNVLAPCFSETEEGSSYDPRCSEGSTVDETTAGVKEMLEGETLGEVNESTTAEIDSSNSNDTVTTDSHAEL